jgi:hypothetical protein
MCGGLGLWEGDPKWEFRASTISSGTVVVEPELVVMVVMTLLCVEFDRIKFQKLPIFYMIS